MPDAPFLTLPFSVSENRQLRQNIPGSKRNARPLTDQQVAAVAEPVRDPSRHRIHVLPLFQRHIHGNPCPALLPCLHHENRIRQTGNNLVPEGKEIFSRRRAGRKRGENSPSFLYPLIEPSVVSRITDIHAASQYRIRASPCPESLHLADSVDSPCHAAYDIDSAGCDPLPENTGNIAPVIRALSGSYDGKSQPLLSRQSAQIIEDCRRIGDFLKSPRIFTIPQTDHAYSLCLQLSVVLQNRSVPA